MDDLHTAGRIAANALKYGRGLIVPGSSLLEVTQKIEDFIIKNGGGLAFPVQISLDEFAAHSCAGFEGKTLFAGQMAKLDLGVEINGTIADNACTVDLSGRHQTLVAASIIALDSAINAAIPGARVCEVGAAIHAAITRLGFVPIRNLSGHGLGNYNVHAPPTIPNYDNGDSTLLVEGQVIAIEPFATTGIGLIEERGVAEVLQLAARKPVRNLIAREILAEISPRNNLPFARRWIERKFGPVKANYGLNELSKMGMIHIYRPLAERSGGLVSQAEHTIIVGSKPEIITAAD